MAHLSEDAGLIEAFTLRGGPAHLRRDRGRSASRPRRSRRSCAGGSRRCPTASPTGCPPSACPAAEDLRRRGEGADGGVLRAVRRDPRLPATARRRGPQEGYTETVFGRRRYLPDLTSDNRQRREMAERMALNAPIQGCAADIIKVAMLGRRAAHRPARACARGCCCRCTTSWSRGRAGGAGGDRGPASAGRWPARPTSRWPWRSRSASAPTGTPPRTEPSAAAALEAGEAVVQPVDQAVEDVGAVVGPDRSPSA